MLDYTETLEDTIWCNDRTIDGGPIKSKDEDSSKNYWTYFGANGRNERTINPSVICPEDNDKFTVNKENGNGALVYPVALLTADEMTLAGHGYSGYTSSSYLYTGETNWSLSPYRFSDIYAHVFYLTSTGKIFSSYQVNKSYGVRPAVSLVSGTKIVRGDGTSSNPYIVK